MKHAKLDIRVGARGWQYNDWVGGYYPDDLPQDWQFSYYSNEFKTVLVPYDYLEQYSPEEWQEWVDDTGQDFTFYVELSESAKWDAVKPYLQLLGDQLRGVVVVIDTLQDVQALTNLINKVKHLAPVCIKRSGARVSDQDMATLQACHAVNECWDGERDTPTWNFAGIAIIIRENAEENSPEKLRHIIEKGMAAAGKSDAMALFFAGSSPRITDINNARMMTELLV